MRGQVQYVLLAFNCFHHCCFWHFGNTFIFHLTTLVYQTTEDYVGFGASEKISNRCSNFSWKFETSTMNTSLFIQEYIPVYTDGSRDGNSVACTTVFPSDTEFSLRLPDSASIFTAEIWAIIKALGEIKNASASKFIIFTDSLSFSSRYVIYEAGTSFNWDGDTKMSF